MEKRYLIKLSEFILEMGKTNKTDMTDEECFSKIFDYTRFIIQPINLGQFIACDLKGNFLEEPKRFGHFKNYGQFGVIKGTELKLCKEYKEAQERVLFKGCVVEKCKSLLGGEEFMGVTINGTWCGGWENFLRTRAKGPDSTLEDITHLKIELK